MYTRLYKIKINQDIHILISFQNLNLDLIKINTQVKKKVIIKNHLTIIIIKMLLLMILNSLKMNKIRIRFTKKFIKTKMFKINVNLNKAFNIKILELK